MQIPFNRQQVAERIESKFGVAFVLRPDPVDGTPESTLTEAEVVKIIAMLESQQPLSGRSQLFVGPVRSDAANPTVADIEKMVPLGGLSVTIPITMTAEEREQAISTIDRLIDQERAAKLAQQEKLVEILGQHRHLYNADVDESYGCSCGWTQESGQEAMRMEVRVDIGYPFWRWRETMAEDLFSRHLSVEIMKGLFA